MSCRCVHADTRLVRCHSRQKSRENVSLGQLLNQLRLARTVSRLAGGELSRVDGVDERSS